MRVVKQTFPKIGPFSTISVQNRPEFGRSASIRPLLSYAAEQSASWQWQQCRLKREKSSPAYEAHDGDEGADDDDDDERDMDDGTAADHHDKNG